MMVDIALEPRSVLAANVARSKNHKSHDLYKHLAKFDPFSDTQELLLRTAYGYNTLGMPRLGLGKNIDNIDARLLQQFIMDNITPQKCLIVASGVKNHKEYVDLVKERLGNLSQSQSTNSKEHPPNISVVSTDNGLRHQQPTSPLPLSPATGAQKISMLITL